MIVIFCMVAAVALAAASSSVLASDAFPSPLSLGTLGSTLVAVFANAAAFRTATLSYAFSLDFSTGLTNLVGSLRFWDPVDLTISLVCPSFNQSPSWARSISQIPSASIRWPMATS